MSAQLWPWSPAAMQRLIIRRYRLSIALAAVTMLTQGCTAVAPRPFVATQASDPDTDVPLTAYRSVVGGYSSQRPAEPLPWTERNQSVAPQPKKDGQ